MAVLETKIIQVANDPSTINRVNEEWGYFGWNVQNVQITNSQDSRTYTSASDYLLGNYTKTVETTTINYATITYQRDKGIPNYAKVVELERQYDATCSKLTTLINDVPAKFSFMIFFLLFFFLFPGSFVYLIVKIRQKSAAAKKEPARIAAMNELRAQLTSIAAEASTLL